MGPLATEPQYQKVLSFFASAASEGAALATGGQAAGHLGGYFVEPTVLTNVKPTMTVACEEVFGPVLAVTPFDTEEEAIGLANDTRYGLACGVDEGHRPGATGWPTCCGPVRLDRMPTGWSARMFRSAGSGERARPRNGTRRSTSTPRTKPSGSSHRRHPRPLHPRLSHRADLACTVFMCMVHPGWPDRGRRPDGRADPVPKGCSGSAEAVLGHPTRVCSAGSPSHRAASGWVCRRWPA